MSFNLNVQLAPVNFNNPAKSRLQKLTLRHLTDISAVAVTVGEGASVTGSAGSEMIVASEQTHLRENRAPRGLQPEAACFVILHKNTAWSISVDQRE